MAVVRMVWPCLRFSKLILAFELEILVPGSCGDDYGILRSREAGVSTPGGVGRFGSRWFDDSSPISDSLHCNPGCYRAYELCTSFPGSFAP